MSSHNAGRGNVRQTSAPTFVQISSDVKKIETSTEENNKKRITKELEKGELPARLGYGEAGTATKLLANCFPLNLPKDVTFYLYNVALRRENPPPKNEDEQTDTLSAQTGASQSTTNTNNPAQGLASTATEDDDPNVPKGTKLGQIMAHIFKTEPRFRQGVAKGALGSDARNLVISTEQFKPDELFFTTFYRGEKSRYRNDEYKVTMTETKRVTSKGLLEYLGMSDHTQAYSAQNHGNKEPVIQALNILLRHRSKFEAMRTGVEPPTQAVVGSKVYNLEAENKPLGGGVVAIAGYFSSIRPAAGRLLANVNVTHGTFYRKGTLQALIKEVFPRDGLTAYNVEAVNAFIKNIRVHVTHRNEKDSKNRPVMSVKKIFGLADKSDGTSSDSEVTAPPNPPLFDINAPNRGAGCNQIRFWLKKKKSKEEGDDKKPSKGKKAEKGEKDGEGKDEGKYIYVDSYFRETYPGFKFEKTEPAVNLGTRLRPSYHPISACEVVPGQNYRETLDGKQTELMIGVARQDPGDALASIAQSGLKATRLTDQMIHGERLAPSPALIEVPGRQLETPKVKFGEKEANVVDRQNKGEFRTETRWNLRDNDIKYNNPGKWLPWALLLVRTSNKHGGPPTTFQEKEAVNGIWGKMNTRGIATAKDEIDYWPPESEVIHVCQLKEKLKQKLDNLRQKANKKVGLVFVLLPDRLSGRDYSTLKRIADVEAGIHTICIQSRNIKGKVEKDGQFWDNIMLKANLKLGGSNQSVTFDSTKILPFTETMVLGLDVTHPPPGSPDTAVSIAGMVASVDQHLGQWPATIAAQTQNGEEVVFKQEGIRKLLEPHLQRWKKNHNTLPKQIIVYRDGVSEGQYSQVVDNEYRHIKSVCERLYANLLPANIIKDNNARIGRVQEGFRTQIQGIAKKDLSLEEAKAYAKDHQPELLKRLLDLTQPLRPKITIIIVGKRHHIRFYTKDALKDRKRGNPIAGTVVDRGVTSQFLWEFYMQSHTPILGTARPIHYVVVVDEIFKTIPEDVLTNNNFQTHSDLLQHITNRLSYTLGRATTAISVCTPAFLADKVCDRARCYLSPDARSQVPGEVHAKLRETMFYI